MTEKDIVTDYRWLKNKDNSIISDRDFYAFSEKVSVLIDSTNLSESEARYTAYDQLIKGKLLNTTFYHDKIKQEQAQQQMG